MSHPTIVVAGRAPWFADLQALLGARYTLYHQPHSEGYIRALVDTLAVMVIVDGDSPDWERFTTTPKVSPATRRIPVVVIADDPKQRALSAQKGADWALALQDVPKTIDGLLADFGRYPDAQALEQLDCQCQEPLPPLARQGVEKFNAGEYYAQHDLFEAQWVQTSGPIRDLYRAILQVGVAYYQIERGNYRGALKMLQRSVQWLALLPDICQGVDVRRLREDSYRVRAELERLGEARFSQFDHALIRGLHLVE